LVRQQLGLRSFNLEFVDHYEPILSCQFRQDCTHGTPIHLFVDLLRVILRPRRKGHAPPAPKWAACRTGARTSSALLTPGLLTAPAYLGARLLRTRSNARCSHIC